MIFKCRNCGGNTVYSPEKHGMYCPFCDSEGSEERTDEHSESITVCPSCGGELKVEEHTSATRCPSCDCYLIFDERVEGEYAPGFILPFQLGRETCKLSLRKKFGKYRFAPSDFLSEAKLDKIEGIYVPFWLFDYDTRWDFHAEGTKLRSWTSGNTAYTEASIYDVERDMDIAFRKIPVDASIKMPDSVMDQMEPYDYQQLEKFDPRYLSGFYAEKYNMPAQQVEERAKKKMTEDAERILSDTYSGQYSSVRVIKKELHLDNSSSDCGMLPVWRYLYQYGGQSYPFYINGQTGRIVGEAPISKKKVLAYSGTLWACLTLILIMIQMVGKMF